MICNCENTSMITDSTIITKMEKESLTEIKLDIDKWRTLYQCKFCNTFWEERFIEDRFVDIPQLYRVEKDYIEKEWKIVFSET